MDKKADPVKEIQRAYYKEYRAKNPDKIRENNKRYWEKKAAKALTAVNGPDTEGQVVQTEPAVTIEPIAVSVEEAAQLIGVSRPMIYKLIESKKFPYFKIGTRTLVPVAELKAWVSDQCRKMGDADG